jgi:hypothetical protein
LIPVVTGIVPGGPADKYDASAGPKEKIEAHDTICEVDGEVATETNILRLLRGDGKVGSRAVITVQKFVSSPSAPTNPRPVEVTLYRDYKWWVEGMRDVAVAVEQVRNDFSGSISEQSNDESVMHTVWQMDLHKQLRKLSELTLSSQDNLRAHIEALEDALLSSLRNAHAETIRVENELTSQSNEARAQLEFLQDLNRKGMAERELEQQLKPKPAVAAAEPAVLERYREMVHNLQHDLKEVQAKNVQLLTDMHELRLDNGITQAALADSHNMQTRTAFMHVREVEDKNSHAYSALKASQRNAALAQASLELVREGDDKLIADLHTLMESVEKIKARAAEAERREMKASDELAAAIRINEELRQVLNLLALCTLN